MDGWKLPGEQNVFHLHQPFDWQPTLHACGAQDFAVSSPGFCPAHPEIELDTNPRIQEQEHELKRTAESLGIIAVRAADKLLPWSCREFSWLRNMIDRDDGRWWWFLC